MLLKSFGCSFIFGSDLHDDGRNLPFAVASRHTWPALLARKQGWDYKCYARPGSGNLRIAESVLNQINNIEPSVFVIGWTWIDRFDYTDSNSDKWATLMPVDSTAQADFYYRNLHSQYRDKLTSLIHINTVVSALKASGHRYIMTYMDSLLFETQWHHSPAVGMLQHNIKDSMTLFENKTFLDWSRSNGYQISKTLHPLESAHQAACELISNMNLV